MKNSSFGLMMLRTAVPENIGVALRTAHVLGADFMVLVGVKQRKRPRTDTPNAFSKMLILEYDTVAQAKESLWQYELIGLEQGGTELYSFEHPKKAIYVLGNEREGITPEELKLCSAVAEIPSVMPVSLNVAQAAGIVLYDRNMKAFKG